MSHPRALRIFCDHKNMEYLLNPPKTLKAAAISRLYRWVLLLQNFRMTVFHLKGEFNRFADVLSRWAHLGGEIRELEEQQRAMEIFRPKRKNNSRISGTLEIVDPPLSTEKWIQVASLVAQATSEEALKPVLNGPYWSLAVNRWTDEEEYNDFLWRRISFLCPAYEEAWEPVTEEGA